ncbi:VWA domain-containing protein [Pseudorhodoplanes sp.]|uniref:vWA domain-containing protein n=1 Tax=Pseudorhodoplanes sp. TaxID=1934341 RepID=UPI003D0AA6EC
MVAATEVLKSVRRLFADFGTAKRGNVMVTFALATIPVIGSVGAAVDYSRANSAKTALQAAIDSAALILSKDAQTLTQAQLAAKANALVKANFNYPTATDLIVTPTFTTPQSGSFTLDIKATAKVPTSFTAMWQPTMAIGADAEVLWGMKRLELVLALDVTGSMSSSNKMTQLKIASKDMLKTLQNAAKKPDDIKVGIVPFATDVSAGTGNVNANWIRWDEWEAEHDQLSKNQPSNWSDIGPGSSCPFTNSNPYKFRCLEAPGSTRTTNTIPSSGTYKGYICPSENSDGTEVNGCYNSQEQTKTVDTGRNASCGNLSDCSCSGSGRNKVCTQVTGYKHEWVANDRNTWNGCVWDRDQDNDVKNTATSTGVKSTLYSANQAKNCPAAMLTLTSSWSALNGKIDELAPAGNTNVTIGLQVAFQMLSPVSPFSAATPKADLDKVIVLLTDGDNTQNRWTSNQNSIDARTKLACANVKAANIKLYTIRVINGNASLLKECATKSDMYFDVQNANQLSGVFSAIAQNLANLRLAK